VTYSQTAVPLKDINGGAQMEKQALHDALKRVEFISLNEYDPEKESVCPWCGNSREEGHRSYCLIMQALRVAERKIDVSEGCHVPED
jgi:hypothetical protein